MFFKRKIELIFQNKQGEQLVFKTGDDESKEFVMDITINKYYGTQANDATVTIYNMSQKTYGNIIANEYNNVFIKAGYVEGEFGLVFNGYILNASGGKTQNIVDNTTTFICMDGGEFIANSFISNTYQDSVNWYSIIEDINSKSTYPIDIKIDESLKNTYPYGGYTSHGSVQNSIEEISGENYCVATIENNQMTIERYDNEETSTAIVLNSESGMIEIPELTEEGINIKSLLNPNYKILGLIKVNNADIATRFNTAFPERKAWLVSDGVYKIAKIMYNINNRDGDFLCELTCINRSYYSELLGG